MKEASSGIKWLIFSRLSKQILQLLTLIVLARLLGPNDFGLMTTAMVVIGLLNIFRDLGTAAAVIQKKVVTQILISTLFWVNIFIGITISGVLFMTAPLIAEFYKKDILVTILQVLSVSFLISSFSAVQQALMEKQLEFDKLAKYEISATLFGSSIGIILAFFDYGVWSLVFQTLLTTLTLSLILIISYKLKPKLVFSWRDLKSISNFSLNLAGFNVLNYFVRNTDYILIQKFLGEKLLGYYNLAYRIMFYPVENINSVVSRVMFPHYSKFQDDNEKFRNTHIELVTVISFITFPLMLFIIATSDIFILTIFGEKWEPVIPVLNILAPVGMMQSVYSPAGAIYQSKGRTDWWFKWGIFTGILFVLAFIIGIKWGIIGVALAFLIVNLLTIYPGLYIPFKLIGLRVVDFLQSFHRTFIISFSMSFSIFWMKFYLIDFLSFTITFILSLIAGTIFYLILSWKFNSLVFGKVIGFIKSYN